MRNRLLILACVVSSLISSSASAAWRSAAWIAPWDPNSLASIQNNAGALQESNPVWYEWNADGTIKAGWNAENPTWRAAMTGTKLLPTVQNVIAGTFSATASTAMLSSVTAREAHVTSIVNLVLSKAYDGIDIDYERVVTTERADFTAFITSLSQKLHASGKQLSVTVYAKQSDAQNWNGPGSQDWIALGKLADTIKIMAYDYSYSSSVAGPITPIDWLDKVTTYAQSVIQNDKIIIGLPWYGYDWVGTTGKGVTYASAMQVAQANGVTPTRDANGELTYTYGGNHTVYFQDAASYTRKVWSLKQNHPSIGGFAHWCAGQEDPDTWKTVRENPTTFTVAAPGVGASPAAADFTISGPSSISVAPGTTAAGDYRIVSINSFNAPVTVSVLPIGNFDGTITATQAGTVVTVQVTPRATTRPGVYAFAVRMTSGSLVHEQTVAITVAAAQPKRSRAAGH